MNTGKMLLCMMGCMSLLACSDSSPGGYYINGTYVGDYNDFDVGASATPSGPAYAPTIPVSPSSSSSGQSDGTISSFSYPEYEVVKPDPDDPCLQPMAVCYSNAPSEGTSSYNSSGSTVIDG